MNTNTVKSRSIVHSVDATVRNIAFGAALAVLCSVAILAARDYGKQYAAKFIETQMKTCEKDSILDYKVCVKIAVDIMKM